MLGKLIAAAAVSFHATQLGFEATAEMCHFILRGVDTLIGVLLYVRTRNKSEATLERRLLLLGKT